VNRLNLRNIRQRDISIAILVLTVLLGVLWYFYMYQPAQDRIAQLDGQIAGLNQQILVGERARDSIEQLQADIAELSARRIAFLRALPRESEVAALLEQLRLGADVAGVVFNSVSQGGAGGEQIQDVRPIGFTVSTSGNYLSTMNFLSILERLQRFTKIRQVGLAIDEEGLVDPLLNATYDFTVYVFTGDDPGELAP
jgi:type IV pilus assembly protein PilO